MSKINRASRGYTAVQVGTVTGRSGKDGKPDQQKDTPKKEAPTTATTNFRSDNATVGVQAGVVTGDITIVMGK